MTYAIYQDTPGGRIRVGTFRYRGKIASVRMVSEAFHKRCPNAESGGKLWIAKIGRTGMEYALCEMDEKQTQTNEKEAKHDGREANG